MNDMLNELMTTLASDSDILKIQATGGFKSYSRREELNDTLTSVTVTPSGTPESNTFGSNTALTKHFIYQVSIESIDRLECKKLQKKVEDILLNQGFHQMNGGLDEYFSTTKRYVDARFYQGNSALYQEY